MGTGRVIWAITLMRFGREARLLSRKCTWISEYNGSRQEVRMNRMGDDTASTLPRRKNALRRLRVCCFPSRFLLVSNPSLYIQRPSAGNREELGPFPIEDGPSMRLSSLEFISRAHKPILVQYTSSLCSLPTSSQLQLHGPSIRLGSLSSSQLTRSQLPIVPHQTTHFKHPSISHPAVQAPFATPHSTSATMNFPPSSSPGVTNRKPAHPYAPLPGPSSSSAYPNGAGGGAAGAAYTLERQNDEHVDRLHEKAAMLKHLTLNLGVEIDESNKFLDTMSTSFVQTEGLLGSASRKLKDLSRSGGANLWCYMTLFIFCVFLFVYFALWRK